MKLCRVAFGRQMALLLFLFAAVAALADEPASNTALQKVQSPDMATRKSGLEELEQFGPTAPEYLPQFTHCLGDSDASLRQLCARALGKLGPAAAPSVMQLAALLKDDDRGVKLETIQALGRIGPEAQPVIGLLGQALEGVDKAMKISILAAMQDIGGEEVLKIPQLEAMLRDDDWLVRSFAVDVVARVQTPEAERLLSEALNDSSDQVFLSADEALKRYPSVATKLLLGFARFRRRVPFLVVVFLSLLLLRRAFLALYY